MIDVASDAQAAADRYREQARRTTGTIRSANLAMAAWWDDRALRLRVADKVRRLLDLDLDLDPASAR